ncbi:MULTISPECIES: hypothetical protein [unclassified Streptomyces]|uniref:hypothetical protein n=1 Tax=unclassified Streptomyces TaxID=2593676 RepID=UPI0033A9ACEA
MATTGRELRHARRPVQMVVDDLAAWNTDALPYIQDIPLRSQSILLEAVGNQGSIWETLERS